MLGVAGYAVELILCSEVGVKTSFVIDKDIALSTDYVLNTISIYSIGLDWSISRL